MLIKGGPTHWRLSEVRDDDGNPLLVAVCKSPKAVVCGRTEKELLAAMEEAMVLTLDHLARRGLLEAFAAEAGLTVEELPARAGQSPVNGVSSVLQPAHI